MAATMTVGLAACGGGDSSSDAKDVDFSDPKSTGGDERTDCIIFEIRRGKRMSMKFLIVSDTHGRMYNLEEAMEREEFDGMIHCGDVEGMDDLIKSKVNGPCYMVMGNNDWFSNLPV